MFYFCFFCIKMFTKECLLCNYEGLKIILRTNSDELLKHPEFFHIFIFHPIHHYTNEAGDYIGGEVIVSRACTAFKNCGKVFGPVKYDIVLDYSEIIWKKLFHILARGHTLDYDVDKENKICTFHFDAGDTDYDEVVRNPPYEFTLV